MSRSTILVIEDERDIRELVGFNLEKAGFRVLAAEDGAAGLSLARKERPDLIVLDLMLPSLDGKEVCRRIRQDPDTAAIPIIMLTALTEEVDRIVGLELGADDYLTKPFSPRELVLRIKAVLRRGSPVREAGPLRLAGLIIDPDRHRVEAEERPVDLTATEFKLLQCLAENAGRVMSRSSLLDRVWGYSFDGYGRTVDTHIRRLRRKLGASAELIETVRGLGYRLRDE
jgi:two-component system phosphate regulon response regulator PhoB